MQYREIASKYDLIFTKRFNCNIENYSIYYHDGRLFTYYEYTGDDYEADMAKMAADPETQRWWDECIPCLDPYTEDGPWLDMERVYRLD